MMASRFKTLLLLSCVCLSAGEPAAADDTAAVAAEPPMPPVLLNLESSARREGWTNVASVAAEGVDVVAPMDDFRDFGNETVTAIYAAHVLGHASYGTLEFEGADAAYGAGEATPSQPRASQLERTLAEWHRVLKPGGALLVSTPDLQTLARMYLDDTLEFAERFFVMRMMFGGQTTPVDFQRTGFDFETLALYLNGTGFCRMARRPADTGFGIFEADASTAVFKGVPISVNIVAHACKPGEAIEVSLDGDAEADDAAAAAAASGAPSGDMPAANAAQPGSGTP